MNNARNKLPLLPASLLLVLIACDSGMPSDTVDRCAQVNAELGHPVCLSSINDESSWTTFSKDGSAPDQVRLSKYMVPAHADARLPTLFMNVNEFVYHLEFMITAFPSLFSGLSGPEYNDLILKPDSREFYAGVITQYRLIDETVLWGYNIWDDSRLPNGALTCEQAQAVHKEMAGHFTLTPLAIVPTSNLQKEMLKDCPLPVYDADAATNYEVYNPGVGYGYVRRYTTTNLQEAQESFDFGWRNILALDEAPHDIETVIAGAITGTRQGELSHLNIRSAARGAPNCYAANAYTLFADWEDRLVRFECGKEDWSVTEASLEEAEAWWAELKPDPIDILKPDFTWTDFASLLDLPTSSTQERQNGVQRYGSKGANLGMLYQSEPLSSEPQYRLDGFLVPFAYYNNFMESQTWNADLGSGLQTVTFAQTIDAFLTDDEFQLDGRVRKEKLTALRDAIRASEVDQTLIDKLADAIKETWEGNDDVMVRFRSSSNAEDSLSFSGAGLYNSTSACLADELDGDEVGPSLCDPDKSNERSIRRALTRVWGSLWEMKAYEEREWYGIDHNLAAMAILVNTRTKNEQSNIVAFTGNPFVAGDDRYLINAQIGELDVVSPPPGVFPEKDMLEFSESNVSSIVRVSGSSELPEGEYVMSDQELNELGNLLRRIENVYPLDVQAPPGVEVLFDTEWKVRQDGQLIIKQIRPFKRLPM
ncbi:MAG: hypothetical protein GY854_20650 [Deltaproteobacteria bacterium]|nr:hypothetical protein [Deltaproteobacteria bacterium]